MNRRDTAVTLPLHIETDAGDELTWLVNVQVHSGNTVEFIDASRDGLTLDWDEFCATYQVTDWQVTDMEQTALETVADRARDRRDCAADAHYERVREGA